MINWVGPAEFVSALTPIRPNKKQKQKQNKTKKKEINSLSHIASPVNDGKIIATYLSMDIISLTCFCSFVTKHK